MLSEKREPSQKAEICCPDCGNPELQTVDGTEVDLQTGFLNGPKGTVGDGGVLFAAATGKCFVCSSCGRRLESPDSLRKRAKEKCKRDLASMLIPTGGFLGVMALLFFAVRQPLFGGVCLALGAALTPIAVCLPIVERQRRCREADAIEQAIQAQLAKKRR